MLNTRPGVKTYHTDFFAVGGGRNGSDQYSIVMSCPTGQIALLCQRGALEDLKDRLCDVLDGQHPKDKIYFQVHDHAGNLLEVSLPREDLRSLASEPADENINEPYNEYVEDSARALNEDYQGRYSDCEEGVP